MILIVGYPDDVHIQAVQQYLDHERKQHFLFSTKHFRPSQLEISASGTDTRFFLFNAEKRISLDEIETVWLRRTPQIEDFREFSSKDDARFTRAEMRHVLHSIWPALSGRRWMNDFQARSFADCKPNQIRVAKELGIPTPQSLITSSQDAALAFCLEHGGDIIYKTLSFFGKEDDGKSYTIYTNRLDEASLRSRLAKVELAPCLFQKYIEKRIELRTVIIGDDMFTVSFDSQASAYSAVDWRRYDFDNVAHVRHELPLYIAERLQALMKALGLVFGCIDMILTPNDEYVFLEVNEAGNWLWLDALASTTITAAIAAYLGRQSAHPGALVEK